MRPLVHEPMKTTSTGISLTGVPGTSPMYARARRASSGEANGTSSGRGTTPVTSTVMAGFVPQVTWGASEPASMRDPAVEGGGVVGPQGPP